MKRTLKFFYEPNEQQYYVYYSKGFATILYKVENVNPLMLKAVNSWGTGNINLDKKLIDEVEDFTIEELKKLNYGY